MPQDYMGHNMETAKNLMNKCAVLGETTIGVDQNVIEVHNYGNVEHVTEDVIHELLECGGGIGESLWND